MKIRVSLIGVLASLMILAAANAQEKKERPKLPEGAQGFSGTVQGKVVSVKEGRVVFAVEKVVNVWKANKAEKPESLVGVKIMVTAKEPKGLQGRFIKTLKADESLSLEVRNEKGPIFLILELTEEQRKRGDEASDRPSDRVTDRPSERDIVKRRIEVMKMAMPALREGKRGDAVELLERAIRGYEVALEERSDEEAQRIRQRMPKPGQLAEILTMASNLWREFNNEDKAAAVGRLAKELGGLRARD